ncbi:alpha/beta hydrolase [Dankookia rubra]|uniref:Alpha/beta hydrolase n=1 Tax=Dankookia rubra TaxID=1442381 RepID=A0A4R5QD84_9PROT|nr:alpha/beta hydrolase [Dankookia rubra]TDH60578.1 alpha/beta hydrolase [Dankookia rubra]
MLYRTRRLLRRGGILLAVLLAALLGLRIWDVSSAPPLRPWHLVVPDELPVAALDAADWTRYLEVEKTAFETVRREVTDRLEPEDQVAANRYFAGSPMHADRFVQDWNRSFLLLPDGTPRGAVVFLHGLTDAPYSQRHIAERYRQLGFVAYGIRLPGHGTVPAGLTKIGWEDWLAATRLTVREARGRIGPDLPLHIVGYSNGGALAMKYALDAIEDSRLSRADQLVLISPMIGVTAFARFAGLAALPAMLPAFAKTAWLAILPEFNPFKYNSFPVNGARQSWRLTSALQAQLRSMGAAGRLQALPPVLTFQSVADATVSTPAVLSALYSQLPANGSEIVLFDINRNAKLGPLLSPAAAALADRLLPPAPRRYAAVVVGNADPDQDAVVARAVAAGGTAEAIAPLGIDWPHELYSLSHVALPFPVSDGLYGARPDPAPEEDFGMRLGAVAPRGERGVLVLDLDSLVRVSSNPFYSYLMDRIEQTITAAGR